MKIIRAEIAALGEGGTEVSVTFHWEHREEMNLSSVADVLAFLAPCAGGCMTQSGHVKAAMEHAQAAFPIETVTAELPGNVPADENGKVHLRRRKANPLGEVADAGATPLPSAPADTSAPAEAPIAASAAEPSSPATEPTSRRRRASAEPQADSSASPASTAEADAAPLRRRRAAPAAEGTPATTAPTEATAASPEPAGRRRRAAPSAEPAPAVVEPAKETAPTPPVSEPVAPSISDADMSKAASQGAAVLTPAVVRALMATFTLDDCVTPCTSVNQIHDADRRMFLNELAALIAAAQ